MSACRAEMYPLPFDHAERLLHDRLHTRHRCALRAGDIPVASQTKQPLCCSSSTFPATQAAIAAAVLEPRWQHSHRPHDRCAAATPILPRRTAPAINAPNRAITGVFFAFASYQPTPFSWSSVIADKQTRTMKCHPGVNRVPEAASHAAVVHANSVPSEPFAHHAVGSADVPVTPYVTPIIDHQARHPV